MSFETTVAKVRTVLLTVSGIANVTVEPITSTSRATTETARSVATGQKLQSWEIIAVPIEGFEGAGSYQQTRADITVRARYFHKDRDATSLIAFRNLIAAGQRALMNPDTGIPQIDANGIQNLVKPDMPRKSPTGQSEWYAEFGFRTLDCEHT